MSRVLITGIDGFIGGYLATELRAHGHVVAGVDRKYYPESDLANPSVFEGCLMFRPDVVVHLAAEVGRLHCEHDAIETAKQNAGITAHIAQVCAREGVRLAYASTSEVYGGGVGVRTEDTFPQPVNLYGLSKLWGEQACRLYDPPELTIFRISMPYGPGLPHTKLGYHAALPSFLHLAKNRQPITVHRGAERSWCWIGDTVAGMRTILEKGKGTYNVGRHDEPVSMLEVAELACELTGAPTDLIEEADAPERQSAVKRLSCTKLLWLGWKPTVGLREGMQRTLEAMS